MDLKDIVIQFLPENTFKFTPINNGLINSTFKVETNSKAYILQKINTHVFKYPDHINQNHLEINLVLKTESYSKNIVQIYKTIDGNLGYISKDGSYWRLLQYISDSVTYLKVPNPEIAFKAAACFSEFYTIINKQNLVLKETLPDFINFKKRIADYKLALKNAKTNRLEDAKSEIEIVNTLLSLPLKWIELSENNQLPIRTIHADPKISNILFDTNENAIAVIDLDTMMNATILYDFGDMIRSYCNLTTEDDASLKNNFSSDIYFAVKNGFLSYLKTDLTATEINNLDYAAQVVIYIQAIRFLTDYLNNDVYYSVQYSNHNLNRTKNQINLLQNLLQVVQI